MRVQRRRPAQPVPDDLASLSWRQLCQLRDRGLITADDVREAVHRGLVRQAGRDPYAHLRPEAQR